MSKEILTEKLEHDCPICDNVHVIEKHTRNTISTLKGSVIEHSETVYLCPISGEEWTTGRLLDENLNHMRNAYRLKHGLLTSNQIVEIRNKYGLGQKELSNLLGWGDVTVARYETKLIQDATYDGVLRMIMKSPSFALEELIKHQKYFNDSKFDEIKSRIKTLIRVEGNTELKRQELLNRYVDYDTESGANGFRLLNIDKISDVIAYFANHVNKLYKVKLMKLLWYSDMLHFIKHGTSMTGLVYLHKPLGALPIGHSEIIFLPSVSVDEEETDIGTSYHILPLSTPLNPMFTLEEQDILNKVASKFRDVSGTDISAYMHNEEAYKNTEENKIIYYGISNSIIAF